MDAHDDIIHADGYDNDNGDNKRSEQQQLCIQQQLTAGCDC